jgi:hypothetical protein
MAHARVAEQLMEARRMISALRGPIQQYIDKLNNGSMPAVHHYTSLKGALGILESGQMWFTERSHLNDPSEISSGLQIAEKILCGRDRASDAAQLRQSAERVFGDFRFFSASFSFKCDDLSQWRNYADDGKGVVLSFRTSAFNNPKTHIKRFVKDDPTVLVCPMSYAPECLQSVIGSIVEKWNGSNIGELCDHLFMISSMFQNECWKPEKEYRYFVHHKREKILMNDCHKTRERNGQIVFYLDLPIQNWSSATDFPIYRVCLGPAAPEGLDAQLKDFIFSLRVPIQTEGIARSAIPYRSIRQV